MNPLIPSKGIARFAVQWLCCVLAACSSAGTPLAPVRQVSLQPSLRESPNASGYKLLYSFGRATNDGDLPLADLVASSNVLYGTTEFGGTTNSYCYLGCGTIFRVTASGAEKVTYRFNGGSDGASPVAGLVAFDGALYGTTNGGGTNGHGTVFRLSSKGKSAKILYRFKGGKDGAGPVAGLVALNGTLYGTTQYGGKRTRVCFKGCGTIFSIATSGAETVVYRFKGGADGALPAAPLAAVNGVLYGTTQYGGKSTGLCATGCGTVFEAHTDGTKKTRYSFEYTPSSGDGAYPAAGVVDVNGELYGTTSSGGKYGDGAVFALNESSGAEHVIHSFSCCLTARDGQYPFAGLAANGGTLYGTTRNGGDANVGVIFSVTPSGSESVVHSFGGKPDGALPQSGLTLLGGTLYGATSSGGRISEGSIYKVAP